MTDNGNHIVSGVVIDEVDEITIDEITQFCSVRREKIVEFVMEGIIEPEGREPEEWRFRGPAVARVKKAIRLESDLDINVGAVAIILDLLDEIDELRAALRRRVR